MNSYAIAGQLCFHFDGPARLPDLTAKLRHAECSAPGADSVSIKCYGARALLSKEPWHFYKGIPWKGKVICNEKGAVTHVYFHAFIFRQFLFFRIVLLPLLWRLAVKKGGFYLLGTLFGYRNTTRILFAEPGAGKTRFMLKQLLLPDHCFMGDGSLLYLPGQGYLPVINEIELRRNTVAGLPWKKKLSLKKRSYLQFCHLVSAVTGRFISFNLTLQPEEMGITPQKDSPEREHIFSFVRKDGSVTDLNCKDIQKGIMDYLEGYHRHYLNIYDQLPPWEETRKNIRTSCADCLKK